MIIPRFLKKGDKVGVVATAKVVDKSNTLIGIDILKSWGLELTIGKYVFEKYYQFAGTDAQRAKDLQEMIDNPKLSAIFMVRGGYGSTRIIDQINFESLDTHPKWLCGFSDITAFHLHLHKLGIASMHSPMPSFFYALNEAPLQWFKDIIFGNKKELYVDHNPLNRNGNATGELIGGNLSIICHTIGTDSEIETEGNILFIEDVGEQLYHLDRMMVQLKRAGKLNNLAGLIVGKFTDMKDNEDAFGLDAYEIISSHIKEFDYPVAFGFPIGHTNNNFAVPVGFQGSLSVATTKVLLNIGEYNPGNKTGKND